MGLREVAPFEFSEIYAKFGKKARGSDVSF
jgi:hypothetical protein